MDQSVPLAPPNAPQPPPVPMPESQLKATSAQGTTSVANGVNLVDKIVPPQKIQISNRAKLTTSLSEPGSDKKNRAELQSLLTTGKTLEQQAQTNALNGQNGVGAGGAGSTTGGTMYHAYLYSNSQDDKEAHDEGIAKGLLDPNMGDFRYERIHTNLHFNPVRRYKHKKLIAIGVAFFVCVLWFRYKYVLAPLEAEAIRAITRPGSSSSSS